MKDKDIVGAPKASDRVFSFKPMGPKVPLKQTAASPKAAVGAAKSAKKSSAKAVKKK